MIKISFLKEHFSYSFHTITSIENNRRQKNIKKRLGIKSRLFSQTANLYQRIIALRVFVAIGEVIREVWILQVDNSRQFIYSCQCLIAWYQRDPFFARSTREYICYKRSEYDTYFKKSITLLNYRLGLLYRLLVPQIIAKPDSCKNVIFLRLRNQIDRMTRISRDMNMRRLSESNTCSSDFKSFA